MIISAYSGTTGYCYPSGGTITTTEATNYRSLHESSTMGPDPYFDAVEEPIRVVFEPRGASELWFFLQRHFPKPFPWDISAIKQAILRVFRVPWYHREPGWFNPKPNLKEE